MVGVNANSNTSESIQAELRSEEFRDLVYAKTGKLLPMDETSVDSGFAMYSLNMGDGNSTQAKTLIERYVDMRFKGHSKTYAMARLQVEPDLRAISPDCRAILCEDKDVYLPWLWLYEFTIESNRNFTTYMIRDGAITWSYTVVRKNDRSLLQVETGTSDSKEYLPAYRDIFGQVRKQVKREAKEQGVEGLGSCHWYWRRQKELLKQSGIDWLSPQDLQPSSNFD
jgi:hypothetical protein